MDNTLELILKYNLSIRKIPEKVVSLWGVRKFYPGDIIVEKELTGMSYEKYVKLISGSDYDKTREIVYRFDEENKKVYRKYKEETQIPKLGGHWIVTISPKNTSDLMKWSLKDKNFTTAPTLEEAVKLHVEKIKNL